MIAPPLHNIQFPHSRILLDVALLRHSIPQHSTLPLPIGLWECTRVQLLSRLRTSHRKIQPLRTAQFVRNMSIQHLSSLLLLCKKNLHLLLHYKTCPLLLVFMNKTYCHLHQLGNQRMQLPLMNLQRLLSC